MLLINKQDPDTFINVKQISNNNKNIILSLLEVIITKYVLNMETLKYGKSKTGLDAIREKSIIIKNLSGKEVYDKYMESTYTNDNGDMTLSILKLQKTAKINKIEFLYEDLNIFEKLYSKLVTANIPKGAKVYFSTETTDEKQKKQNLVATMSFSFYKDNEKNVDSTIDFKVNDYYVEPDVSISEPKNVK